MYYKAFKISFLLIILLTFNRILSQELSPPKQLQPLKGVHDTIRPSREKLGGIVFTKADSIRNDLPAKMSYLNRNAVVKYQDMDINADYIAIDWEQGSIFARGKQDGKGRITEPALALQNGKKYEYDQFTFNYKTGQAIAYNARTEESEGVILAQRTKKVNDSVFYMRRGLYTTDQLFIKKKAERPDYYLLAPEIKLIKGKKNSQVITGPIQFYIEDVPTPLALPFGILPFSQERSAGLLMPSFGERQDVGFFLQGLGYYQPLGKYFDLKILADYFTKGSWNIRPQVNYMRKYRYSGSFNADIGRRVDGIRGLDNYHETETYSIQWNHQQDAKANPLFQFGASVNIQSSRFFANTVNNSHIFNGNVLQTRQASSINITKRFLNYPITISATGLYNQNLATGLVDLTLPQLTVSTTQFHLFKPKNGMRQGLLENITVNTNLAANNYVSVNQRDLFTPVMWEALQTGIRNNISLNTNSQVFNFFNLNIFATVDNVLTTKTVQKFYNPINQEVQNHIHRGLAGFSTFNIGAGVQTTLYGQLNFGKDRLIRAIRHVVNPSLSYSFTPDFSAPGFGYYRSYIDRMGQEVRYSRFEGSIYGSPGQGMNQLLNLGVSSNLEMKVLSKTDSTGFKKVKIFENLSLNTSYNLAAQEFHLSHISVNAQTSLFEGRMSINSSLNIDPYERELNAERWSRVNRIGGFYLSNFNIQTSFPLTNLIFGKEEDISKRYSKRGNARNEVYHFDEQNYAHFNQPWSMNWAVTFDYTKSIEGFVNRSASIGVNGNWKVTPYLNLTASTHYDLIAGQLSWMRLGIQRDQRSFSINFNWVPFGPLKVYDFFIGIQANILKDALKYEDRSFVQPRSTF